MDILELVHENQDATIRPFSCVLEPSRCKKSFARRSDLVRHERIHRNERPFQCETCGKAFIQRSALTVHIRVHTGERPHACLVEGCQKAFADSSSLARHRRVHTGKRPYKCPVVGCSKMFCRKTTLTKHQRKHMPVSLGHVHDKLDPKQSSAACWGNSSERLTNHHSPSSAGFTSPSPTTSSSMDSHKQHLGQDLLFQASPTPCFDALPKPFGTPSAMVQGDDGTVYSLIMSSSKLCPANQPLNQPFYHHGILPQPAPLWTFPGIQHPTISPHCTAIKRPLFSIGCPNFIGQPIENNGLFGATNSDNTNPPISYVALPPMPLQDDFHACGQAVLV